MNSSCMDKFTNTGCAMLLIIGHLKKELIRQSSLITTGPQKVLLVHSQNLLS